MNWKEFGKEMKSLELTFCKQYPEGSEKLYFEELQEVDYNTFKKACAEMRKRESYLPILSTVLRYIDEAKYGRFFVPPEESKPLTTEQIENQEEINRQGRLKVAEKILNSPDAGAGAREWARGVIERKGAPLKVQNGPERIGDIFTRN